jgi:ubiquinone/menaquinone biosynthesis C-methylase UbiE
MIIMQQKQHTELNKKKWDLRAENWDDGSHIYFRYMQKRLVAQLDLKVDQTLLDLGCGTGWALDYASRLVNGQGQFYGIDISVRMIERATVNYKDKKNIHFYQTSAEELPFQNDFFDFIICSSSFHHYFNPGRVLSEVHRVLKPRGRIYILDLTSDGIIGRTINNRSRKREVEHVNYYSTAEFKALFTVANLNHISSKPLWAFNPVKVHVGEKPAGDEPKAANFREKEPGRTQSVT